MNNDFSGNNNNSSNNIFIPDVNNLPNMNNNTNGSGMSDNTTISSNNVQSSSTEEKNVSVSNMSGENNPYKDFLPENRFKVESNGISPNVMKGGLVAFYALVAIVIAIIGLRFYGIDVLKVESRDYNMNLSETISLDNMYMSPNVVWQSNSDNVVIENNVITAIKSGEAYIVGIEDNKIVKDLKVSVLNKHAKMYLDKHDMQMTMGSKKKIKVNRKKKLKSKKSKKDNDSIDDDSEDDDSEDDDSEDDEFEDDEFEDDEFEDEDFEDEDFEDYEDYDEDDFEDEEFEDDEFEDDEFEDDSDSEEDDGGNDESDNYDNDDYEADVEYITEELDEEETEETTEEEDNASDDDYETEDEDDSDLTYSSSDEDVVKVDDEGNIVPVSPGTAIITVEDEDGNEDHTYVTIKDDELNLYVKEYNLKMGESIQVDYELISEIHDKKDLKWVSENKDIVTVDSNGKITSKGLGTTNVKVSVGDITENIKVVVNSNVNLPTSLTLSKDNVSLTVGDSIKIAATINPTDATNKKLNWVSNNSEIATVSDGQIIGKSVGKTVIYVTTVNGIKKSINVAVTKKIIVATDITFGSSALNMKVNETKKLSYKITPESTTDKSVTFNYDKNYLSIDNNGTIKTLKAGVTNVTVATKNGHTATIKVNITNPNASVSSVKINEGDLKLSVGATKNLTTTILPNVKKNVTWTSSNSKVVSVNNQGQIKALAVGEAKITATVDKVSSNITVKVSSSTVKLSGVSLNIKSFNLKAGKSQQLSVKYSPDNATNKSVTWTCSNTNVANVDSNGKVTALKKGKAVITAKANDGSGVSDTATINVSYNVSLSLNSTNKVLNVGESFKLVPTVKPSDASQNVTFSSDKTNIVTVDKNGTIKALKVGTAYITVTSVEDKNVSIKCKVEVTKKAVTELSSKDSKVVLKYNDSYKLNIIVKPSNANNKELTYKSSDNSVATVDKNGKVSAKSKTGTAIILITSKDNSSVSTKVKIDVASNDNLNIEKAKSYNKLHKLGELKKTEYIAATSEVNHGSAQALCVAKDYIITSFVGSDKTIAYVYVYDKKGKKKLKVYKTKFGHANGCTYNPNTGKVYFTNIGGSDEFYSFPINNIEKKFEASKLQFKRRDNSTIKSGGIAYDNTNKKYYLVQGDYLKVYNPDTKSMNGIKLLSRGNQDIGAYKGMILYIRWLKGGSYSDKSAESSKCSIDIYRASDGAYLGTYVIPGEKGYEIESIDYSGSGNDFFILFNYGGNIPKKEKIYNKIYKVTIPFKF